MRATVPPHCLMRRYRGLGSLDRTGWSKLAGRCRLTARSLMDIPVAVSVLDSFLSACVEHRVSAYREMI
jgi:hypothetical protein